YNDGHDNRKEHFNNLEIFRKASVRHDVPFWAFAVTTKHLKYRHPSESDLRWKQYTNLAYGAKGLWYFCYWGPADWRGWARTSIVGPANGGKTDLYVYVKTINRAVLDMGDILLGLTSEGVVHTNPPPGHHPFKKNQNWISDMMAEDALIGFFHDKSGASYAMVVNQKHGMNKSAEDTSGTIELTFAPKVQSVVAVNWLDGNPGPLSIEKRKASLRIHGGTGVLLKAVME
ncbi:MAG: hypothetical protein JXM70_26080, partial [Pirellulales bacterium]|nr:hypothetical protein [Pirellulales bacterium]